MTYRVVVQPRAEADVSQIFDWLAEHSFEGARRWFEQWLRVVDSLSSDPLRFGYAPENEWSSAEVRQANFRTRRGRRYRVIFYIENRNVNIVHVRGSGQDLLPPDELRDHGT